VVASKLYQIQVNHAFLFVVLCGGARHIHGRRHRINLPTKGENRFRLGFDPFNFLPCKLYISPLVDRYVSFRRILEKCHIFGHRGHHRRTQFKVVGSCRKRETKKTTPRTRRKVFLLKKVICSSQNATFTFTVFYFPFEVETLTLLNMHACHFHTMSFACCETFIFVGVVKVSFFCLVFLILIKLRGSTAHTQFSFVSQLVIYSIVFPLL